MRGLLFLITLNIFSQEIKWTTELKEEDIPMDAKSNDFST